jgi:hypothetical protein
MAATVCPAASRSESGRIPQATDATSSKRRGLCAASRAATTTGPHLTSIGLSCGSDLPERSSTTSMRLVCIQMRHDNWGGRLPDTYAVPMTSPPSDSPAHPVGAAETWRRRARLRWRIAALLGIIFISLLVAGLSTGVEPDGACLPRPCPQADPWTAVSALGTLAAGIGAIVSSIAAILALRAASAAQNTSHAPAKEQVAVAAAAKPPAKQKRKKKR